MQWTLHGQEQLQQVVDAQLLLRSCQSWQQLLVLHLHFVVVVVVVLVLVLVLVLCSWRRL